jgi:phosphoglycolate phosphatase-like HAD superfamily hydrolase
MIKAIIFDFDGVILESAQIKTDAFQEMFKDQFPDVVEEIVQYHKDNMGISRFVKFRHIFKEYGDRELTQGELDELGENFSQRVMDKILVAPFVPGMEEFLRGYGCEQGKPWQFFIASGTPEEELRDIVARREMDAFFAGVYGSPQEKEAIIAAIMSNFCYTIDEVLFVGDAMTDRRAAEAAGVAFLGRLTEESRVTFSDCHWTVEDFRQLADVITEIENSRKG